MTHHDGRSSLIGIPVAVHASHAALVDAALAACAGADGPADDDGAPPLHLHLFLTTDVVPRDDSPAVAVDGRRLAITGGGVDGWADADQSEARCAVPPALLDDPGRLAAEVLDPLLLFLATRRGRVPVHASGVMAGGAAAVLAGPSGAGKSALALAAHRAGLAVLSDDTVFVQLEPSLRVWGLPRPIHVFPHDAPGDGDGAMRLRSGRWKRAVPLPSVPPPAERAALFLLERGGRAALHPVTPDAAVDWMAALLQPGFDHFRDALPAVVRALAAGGAWRLTLSTDPDEAVRLLRDVLGPA